MGDSSRKTLGRGQALQRVMAQSKASVNVIEMRMANYTNEKIVEFLETISDRYSEPPVQIVPSRNLEPAEEICLSLPKEMQSNNTQQTMSTKARIELQDGSLPGTIPGQFNINDTDFPPL